ncbi:MAG: phytanoyl-CoA dioxygenase family protein [Steroidobacteraceae bacterium]
MGSAGRSGVRYLTDLFAVKLPAGRETRHGGNQRTGYHNDFTTWAVDRAGGLSIWIALADLTPDMGTLGFLSGSQRSGPLGSYRVLNGGDITDVYPELTEYYPSSGPLAFKAGDAVVYSNLCVHGAAENRTDKPRWVYILSCNPADGRWNGAQGELFSSDGMRQFDVLQGERFPVLA